MPRSYVSKVKLPGDTTIYYIKDEEARDLIAQLGDFTAYLGITTTPLTDGSTTNPITIDGDSVTAVAGNIVSYNDTTGSLYTAKDFIFNGTIWQEFANPTKLGKFAYVSQGTATFTPSVSKTGTVSVNNKTLAATAIPATFGTTEVTGATSITTVSTISTNANVITGGSYSKVTAATVTVNPSASFSGTLSSIVTNVTGGGATKAAKSLALYSVTGGQKIVTDTTVSSVTGGAAEVGSMSVYGLASATTKYMTGPESLDKKNVTVLTSVTATTTANNFSATVTDEILTFTAANGAVTTTAAGDASVLSATTGITNGTSGTATTYNVGKSGATTFTQPTVTLTVTSGTYKVSVPTNTLVTDVAAISPTISDVDVTVTGSAVTDSTVSITNTKTALTVAAANKVTVVSSITTSTLYGKVSAYAGGDHNHTVNDTIAVNGNSQTITVNPKTT